MLINETPSNLYNNQKIINLLFRLMEKGHQLYMCI